MSQSQSYPPALILPLPPALATPKPPALRLAGVAAVILGMLLIFAAVVMDGIALKRTWSGWTPNGTQWAVLSLALLKLTLAVPLTIGGILLLSQRGVGRLPALIYAWAAAPVMLAALIILAAAINGSPENCRTLLWAYWYHAALALGGVLFAAALAWMLMTGRAASWLDSRRRVAGAPPPVPAWPPRMSVAAVLSLIFAFVPPLLVMQTISLALGTHALGVIRRSGGGSRGRGLAIAGSLVSLAALLLMVFAAGSITVACALDGGAVAGKSDVLHRFDELALAQRVYREVHSNAGDSSAEAPASLSDLLKATAAMSPVPEADRLIAADRGVRGNAAKSYQGYYFKLATCTDSADPDASTEAPAKKWVIFAWPATWMGNSHSALMLKSSGEICSIDIHGEPPAVVEATQLEQWIGNGTP